MPAQTEEHQVTISSSKTCATDVSCNLSSTQKGGKQDSWNILEPWADLTVRAIPSLPETRYQTSQITSFRLWEFTRRVAPKTRPSCTQEFKDTLTLSPYFESTMIDSTTLKKNYNMLQL